MHARKNSSHLACCICCWWYFVILYPLIFHRSCLVIRHVTPTATLPSAYVIAIVSFIFVVSMLTLLIFQCSLVTSYFTNADSNLLQFAPVERSGKSSLHPSLPRWAIFIVFALYLSLFLLQFTSVGEKKLEKQPPSLPPSPDGSLRLVIVICVSIIIVIVIIVFIVFVFSDLKKKVGKAASLLPPSLLPPMGRWGFPLPQHTLVGCTSDCGEQIGPIIQYQNISSNFFNILIFDGMYGHS